MHVVLYAGRSPDRPSAQLAPGCWHALILLSFADNDHGGPLPAMVCLMPNPHSIHISIITMEDPAMQ